MALFVQTSHTAGQTTLPESFCYILKSSYWGFPCGSAGKESSCNVGDLGSIPGLGRSPEGGGQGFTTFTVHLLRKPGNAN